MDSGELDVRRRDLGPALAVVRVAHDLDPLPAELHAYVEIKFRAPHAIDASNLTHWLISTQPPYGCRPLVLHIRTRD